MFTGGLDTTIVEAGDVRAQQLLDAIGQLLIACHQSPRPIVVRSRWHAIVAGAMLMLAADYVVASDRPAKYGFAESDDLVEGVDELASSVVDECCLVGELMGVVEEQVAGCLGAPGRSWR